MMKPGKPSVLQLWQGSWQHAGLPLHQFYNVVLACLLVVDLLTGSHALLKTGTA